MSLPTAEGYAVNPEPGELFNKYHDSKVSNCRRMTYVPALQTTVKFNSYTLEIERTCHAAVKSGDDILKTGSLSQK